MLYDYQNYLFPKKPPIGAIPHALKPLATTLGDREMVSALRKSADHDVV